MRKVQSNIPVSFCDNKILLEEIYSRANLLVNGLLEVFCVDNGPHLASAITGPVGGDYVNLGLTGIHPKGIQREKFFIIMGTFKSLLEVFVIKKMSKHKIIQNTNIIQFK